jgi:hypothetical protein
MTTTTQALSGTEQGDYLTIQDKIKMHGTPDEVQEFIELQAEIVNTVVSTNSSIQADIGNQVRARILNSSKFRKYK